MTNLDKIGVQWKWRPERKWLAELLANERAVVPLLVYLKSTEVGTREGAVEKTTGGEEGTTRKERNNLAARSDLESGG